MKPKVKVILLVGTFGAFYCAIQMNLQQKFSPQRKRDESPQARHSTVTANLQYLTNMCGNPLSVVFLKIHKTGSTSVRSILEQHRRKHDPRSLVFNFPLPYAGGYPGSFRRDFTVLRRNVTKFELWKPGKRASIMYDHCRFQKDQMLEVVDPRAKYVTIIRDPVKQFESSFHYFYGRFGWGNYWPKKEIPCWFYPYLTVTGGRWVNLTEYIPMAAKSLNESAPWFFRSRNSQAYELGLDPLNSDEKYVLHEAKKLDDTLDLVMVFDHFLESLILLKNLLCIDWDDLVPPPPENAGKYIKHIFTKEEESMVRKLNIQDQILYNYFNDTLWRKVEAYGRERMAKDVVTLQGYIEEKWARNEKDPIPAKPKAVSRPTRKNIPPRPKQDSETETMNLVRAIMKIPSFSPNNKTVYDVARYMVQNYGWCPTRF